MTRKILQRIAYTIPAVWLILTTVFLLIHIVPGDPVVQMLGEDARAEDLAQLRHALGLDAPLGTQYVRYLSGLFRGNWGTSFHFNGSVFAIVFQHFPATIELALAGLFVCLVIAIPAGVYSAARQGSASDHATSFFTLLGLSLPNFALGPLLILVFSIEIGWLPVSGIGGLDHLVLPAVTLGAALAAILTRMVRSAMIEELSSDYVRTARAKGLSERRVLFRHALPNAMIPIITVVGLQFGALLAGTIVTETIFSWPGIGRIAVQAITERDYPLLQGCILVIALSCVLVNLLTDLIYAVIDPRVRVE
jgi:ABC-type dipeptide/oligopeptide/nickel transport system permease component